MMDVSISGTTSAPDAAAAAKAAAAADKANGGGEKTGGFLDALKNARSDKQQHDASDDGTASSSADAEQDADTSSPVPAATQAQPQRPKKPIIDLTQTRPLFSDKQTEQAQADVETDAAPKLQAAKDKSTTVKSVTPTKPAEDVAETATDPRITKLAKMAAGDKSAVDTDQPDDDLSDVLTLLKGGDATDVKAPAQPTANIPHHLQAATATTDTEAKSNTDTSKITDAFSALHAVATKSADDTPVPGTETDADSGTVFRLTRADGRGKSMDITIGNGKSDDSLVETREAKSGQVENVSVLESRRYLGLAQNNNSSSVVSALSSDGEWSSAMQPSSALSNAASWTSTGKVVNTLKIQMHPIDLGLVTATMRLQGEELSVDLKVENGTAYRQLKEDQSKIVESLRAQGFAIDNVTISIAAVDRSDSTTQSGNQGQTQQQPSQNQAQGGQAQARQQSSSERQGENERGGSLAETGVDETSISGSGRSRPGHVYM